MIKTKIQIMAVYTAHTHTHMSTHIYTINSLKWIFERLQYPKIKKKNHPNETISLG